MAMVHTTWRGMYMNGVRIGMTKTTAATHQLRTHRDRAPTHPQCCEAGLGITTGRRRAEDSNVTGK